MPWNDKVFQDAVEQGAAAIGKSRTAALREANISPDTFTTAPSFGRRTDVFERLASVLNWTDGDQARIFCEAMGLQVTILDARATATAHVEGNGQATAAAAATISVSPQTANSRGKIEIFLENVEVCVTTRPVAKSKMAS